MTYDEQHRILIEYLKAKIDIQDWHGVSDAANDLRVLEAQKDRFEVRYWCGSPECEWHTGPKETCG